MLCHRRSDRIEVYMRHHALLHLARGEQPGRTTTKADKLTEINDSLPRKWNIDGYVRFSPICRQIPYSRFKVELVYFGLYQFSLANRQDCLLYTSRCV